jgi:hypothetical protein
MDHHHHDVDRKTPLLGGHDDDNVGVGISGSSRSSSSSAVSTSQRIARPKRAMVQRANTSMMLFSDRAIEEQVAADKQLEVKLTYMERFAFFFHSLVSCRKHRSMARVPFIVVLLQTAVIVAMVGHHQHI